MTRGEWAKTHWYSALRVFQVRPRKFYATRATYISLALIYGAKIRAEAEHYGTPAAMSERRDGKYLDNEGAPR